MTKKELVEKIAGQHSDLTKKKVEEMVGAVFAAVQDGLKAGDKVAWPGFGTFSVVERAAREGRNPRTGEKLKIAASKSVKFKVASGLKDSL